MDKTIIAHSPTQLPYISYQVITYNEKNKTILIAVNILFNNKIIEKIKLENNRIEYTKEFAEGIAHDYLNKKLIAKEKKRNSQKVNQKAKVKAASNLMNDLNI